MKKRIAIVGGGACALMLGCELDPKKYEVTLFEKNKALGRKFLVAGYGGLNMTHSEEPTLFLSRYVPTNFLEAAFKHFNNRDLVNWLQRQGIKTYTGSSGRVFPDKHIKPVAVLNLFVDLLAKKKVQVLYEHEWRGFSNEGLIFKHGKKRSAHSFDVVVFCLGGASWPVTGSKGDWTPYFEERGITCETFMPSNCAFEVKWDLTLANKIEGRALKNCMVYCGEKAQAGEIVLTRFGIEGSGIYPFSPVIREQISKKGFAQITIDFKPGQSKEQLLEKLKQKAGKKTYTENIKLALNLSEAQTALLKAFLSKEEFLYPLRLVEKIKGFELPISGLAQVDKAISTVGGINREEVTPFFELKKLKHHFAIGEMLDYDAPTGGYLLQSCFSMANYLAHHLNQDL